MSNYQDMIEHIVHVENKESDDLTTEDLRGLISLYCAEMDVDQYVEEFSEMDYISTLFKSHLFELSGEDVKESIIEGLEVQFGDRIRADLDKTYEDVYGLLGNAKELSKKVHDILFKVPLASAQI